MLTIKIWCLPQMKEAKLRNVHLTLVSLATSMKELPCTNERDLLVLFPSDLMTYGLGTEILVEISGLEKDERQDWLFREKVAEKFGQAILQLFPQARVIARVTEFLPRSSTWDSERQTS